MRHLRFAVCALFLLASLAAHADSISIFQITYASLDLFPSDPNGGMGFTFIGPGIRIFGQGAFECPGGWCVYLNYTAEGSPVTFGSFVPNSFTIQIGGKTYSDAQAVLNAWTMNPFAALTVPNAGAQAILNGNGLIPGSINTANGVLQFEIKVPIGEMGLNFVQNIENPSYYTFFPSLGFIKIPSPVPEPGSIVLMVTGLAGVLSTARFRKRIFRAR
jgi:PEP-CTERM motif